MNRISKLADRQLSGWWQAVAFIWLSDEALRDSCGFNSHVTSACLIYIFPTLNTGSRNYSLWKKNDWLKNRPFFITENFLGILNRVCVEPMCWSHDFLSLTLAVVESTSVRCYFLHQCRCLSVCVLVVRCVKSWVGESEEIWCTLI